MGEYEEVIVRLDKSNTIIEELVRCKDCRWYQNYDGCFFSTAEVEPLDYCSYGERKTEEESVREVARGFMELVDAIADRKTEQTETSTNAEKVQLKVQLTDEPQTERPCDSCQEFDCYGCEHKQTERSE